MKGVFDDYQAKKFTVQLYYVSLKSNSY